MYLFIATLTCYNSIVVAASYRGFPLVILVASKMMNVYIHMYFVCACVSKHPYLAKPFSNRKTACNQTEPHNPFPAQCAI